MRRWPHVSRHSAEALGLAALFLLAGIARAGAAEYFVDFAAGSDAAPGTAAAPFRHCPGDPAARGRAARAALAAGDTVVFKGGVAYVGEISCPADGVSYDGNSAGTFGAGRAVIRGGPGGGDQAAGFSATGRSGLAFSGLVIESYGGHRSSPWTGRETRGRYGYGIWLDGCSRVTIRRCLFRDLGDWRNLPRANEGYMEGVGVAVLDSGSAIAIDRCEFTCIGRAGIMIEPRLGTRICTDIAITRNDFHDYLRWGVWLRTGNEACTLNGIAIDGNRFHDVCQYEAADWRGQPSGPPHVDGIIAYIGNLPPQGGQRLGTAARPIAIRNNLFYNDAAAASIQNAAVFLDTWGGRVLVCNNVFVNTLYDGNGAVFCLEGTDTAINPPPDYWICNNSFYDTTYAVTLESFKYPFHRGVHILNNIFDKPDAGAGYAVRIMDPGSAPAQLDYDVYWTMRPDQRLATAAGDHLTLAGLRGAGYEFHGRVAHPEYRSLAAGLGASSSANDLHLRAGSPAIGAGLNLSPLFTADRDGVARPAPPAAWSAGAFSGPAAQ